MRLLVTLAGSKESEAGGALGAAGRPATTRGRGFRIESVVATCSNPGGYSAEIGSRSVRISTAEAQVITTVEVAGRCVNRIGLFKTLYQGVAS